MVNKLNLMDVFYFILNPTWRQTKIPKKIMKKEQAKKKYYYISIPSTNL